MSESLNQTFLVKRSPELSMFILHLHNVIKIELRIGIPAQFSSQSKHEPWEC